ncbi:MAG TPA: cytochrome c-type biogenesis protein CcmH [Gaiellaceae bacterium]
MRLVVGLMVVALALAAPAAAGPHPSADAIETELVCPVCHETLDQSTAPIAMEMKREIRVRIAQGWTKKQIIDEMVRNFGPQVLSTPAKSGFDLLAWVLPLGGAVVGVAALAAGAVYWSRTSAVPPAVETGLDADTERRIDEELARFDG